MNPWTYVLLASLAANGVLGWAYMGKRDAAAVAVEQRDDARGLASACSDATEDLATQAAARLKLADAARRRAVAAAKTLNEQADLELATPAAVPGDVCASAQARVTRILESRK